MKHLFIIFHLVFFAWSCSKKALSVKSNTSENNSNKDLAIENIIQSINSKKISAKFIQAKGQIKLDDGGFFSSGSLNLRIAADSLIWFSISKLGFEIARGLINQDSAYAINNWENTYWKGSIHDISEKYHVPAEFGTIQSIVIPSLNPSSNYLIEKQSAFIKLQEQGTVIKKYNIDQSSLTISSMMVSHASADFKVSYSDYISKDSYQFPHTHHHVINQNNQMFETELRFSSIQSVASLNTPFKIPSDYELIK